MLECFHFDNRLLETFGIFDLNCVCACSCVCVCVCTLEYVKVREGVEADLVLSKLGIRWTKNRITCMDRRKLSTR